MKNSPETPEAREQRRKAALLAQQILIRQEKERQAVLPVTTRPAEDPALLIRELEIEMASTRLRLRRHTANRVVYRQIAFLIIALLLGSLIVIHILGQLYFPSAPPQPSPSEETPGQLYHPKHPN